MNSIEMTRAKWDKYGKIFLVVLGALIVSPIIFMVVQGMIGLAIAAGVGLFVVNFAPVLSMKLANWKVKGIVAEAKENPIETLENLLIEKKAAFKKFALSVEEAITAVKQFEQKCKTFSVQYPARAAEFDAQLKQMQNLVDKKKDSLVAAKSAISLGEDKLKECRAYYDMAMAAQAANKAANMDTGDVYEELKANTAVDSVLDNMSKVFAQIEVADALENQKLEYQPAQSMFTQVTVSEKVYTK